MLLSVAEAALSCTCIDAPLPACEQAQVERSNLFVGKVVSIAPKTVLLPLENKPFKMRGITFQVLETFNESKDSSVTVLDWPPGNGSCGYPFEIGETYLVDAAPSQDNSLQIASCGLTAHVNDAEDVLKFLRLRAHSNGGILFGTVKEYVGQRNFMSKQNKPIAGQSVFVEGPSSIKVIQTDKSGWFALADLNPGQYLIRLDAAARYAPTREHSIDLANGGCAQVDYRIDRVQHEH